MDDITPLQTMTSDTMGKDAVVFEPRDAVMWKADRKNQTEVPGDKWWEGEVAPRGSAIAYWLKSAASDVKVTITNTANNQTVRTCVGTGNAGLNRFQWAMTGDPQPGGGGGGGGRGGGRGAAQPDPNAQTQPTGPTPCSAPTGGGGRGGGGGGGGFGGGGGPNIGPGVYRVTVTAAGKEIGTQTFKLVEDTWLNEK
jgi:hypothetical protein